MAKVQNNHYTDDDIQVLEGLEAVRKRPGMYIGSVDSRGLHHLIWEIVDNAVDEALAGYGKEIIVKVLKDSSVEIIDNGRGVPVGMHKSGVSTPEVVYTKLHAGGKFSSDGGYKAARTGVFEMPILTLTLPVVFLYVLKTKSSLVLTVCKLLEA